MRSFIVGDLHGGEDGELRFFSNDAFPVQKELTREDIVFQLGDFSLYYHYKDAIDLYKRERNNLIALTSKNYTWFVILGNHENYDMIYELPIIEKWGGRVYMDNVEGNEIYFAIRGEIYTINGKTIFTFGGARSSDIEDRNTLEEHLSGKKKFRKRYRYGEHIGNSYKRVKLSQVSWWKQEVATQEEMDYAMKKLAEVNFKVDYVFTHTCPTFMLENFIDFSNVTKNKFTDPMADFLEEIYYKLEFKHWYLGHLHTNKTVGKFTCHYMAKPTEVFL